MKQLHYSRPSKYIHIYINTSWKKYLLMARYFREWESAPIESKSSFSSLESRFPKNTLVLTYKYHIYGRYTTTQLLVVLIG